MYINPERCEQVIFSDPDYQMLDSFIVRKGNPKNLHNYQDVVEKKAKIRDRNRLRGDPVRGRRGLQGERHPRSSRTRSRAERRRGGPRRRLRRYGADHPRGRARSPDRRRRPRPSRPLVDGKPHVDGGGFAFRPTETELRDAFNVELHKMKKSGELFRILQPFGFTKDEMTDTDREGAVRRMTSGLWETGTAGDLGHGPTRWSSARCWRAVVAFVVGHRAHPPAAVRALPRGLSTPRCSAAPRRW